jgi:ATP-dependent DNA helicase RecG
VAQGEGVTVEFKTADVRPESLAREMVSFSNTYGGTLLIGVTDDGAISGLFQAAGLVHFDIAPVEGTDERDLDAEKLHRYWHACYDINFLEMNRDEQNNLLRNADILVSHEDKLVVGVGGLLLFGRQPQRRMPQSSIVFAVFRGTEITNELIDKKEVSGTLPELIENTTSLVRLFLPRPSEISGLKRQEQDSISVKTIREALVNAVCHRDYSLSMRKTTVYMFNDRLEITSPGVIANSLTLEKIKCGNSAPRNMFLLKYLDNLRYSDGLGRGIPMMLKAMGTRMILEEIGDLFRITLRYRCDDYA